jgi:membrane-bound lytic murein transglycosylase D
LASVPTSKLPDVPEFVIHRVRRGEALSTIAVRYRTSVRAIQNANNMRGTMIRIGQRLRIPVANPSYYTSRVTQNAQTTSSGATVHVVRRGDTLWQIAQAYGTSVTQIRRLNRMGTSSRIYPGQRLIVKN